MGIMAGGILNMVLASVHPPLRDQGLGLEGSRVRPPMLSQAVLAGVMLWWFVKREDGAHRARGGVARGADRVAKVGVSAMLMQVLTLVQQAIIYRAAARVGRRGWQRCCSARRCASSRSRSSRCGA